MMVGQLEGRTFLSYLAKIVGRSLNRIPTIILCTVKGWYHCLISPSKAIIEDLFLWDTSESHFWLLCVANLPGFSYMLVNLLLQANQQNKMENPYNGPSAIMVKVKMNICSADDHTWTKHIKLCTKSWAGLASWARWASWEGWAGWAGWAVWASLSGWVSWAEWSGWAAWPQWIWYNGIWYNGIWYNEFDITE